MIISFRTTIFHTRIKNMSRQDEYKTMQILSIKEDKAYLLLHILQEKEKILRLPTTNHRKDY
jgi:hypothetical protein